MSWKNVQYGKKRVRRNYSRVQTSVELPNLLEVQTGSFQWLIEKGLKELFQEISPIKDHGEGENSNYILVIMNLMNQNIQLLRLKYIV